MPAPLPVFETFADLAALSDAAAARLAAAARAAARARGRFAVALAGGGTPRTLHALLAGAYRAEVPWDAVEIWFGDERSVPPDGPASNYRMARETLLDHVPLRVGAVHRMRGELPPVDAAAAYEAELRAAFPGDETFDVVLLGVGADGHTASLFPGAPTLDERERWVVPATAPIGMPSRDRVTLTLPALATAREAWLLCAGVEKRRALAAARRAVASAADDGEPASRVRAREGTLWMVDRAAASAPADA